MTTNSLIRERYCVIVSVLYTLGQRGSAGAHIRAALTSNKVPRKFFEELFFHLSLLLGFPAMLEGLEQIQRVSPRRGSPARISQRTPGKGREALSAVYGNQTDKLLKNFHNLHPDVPRLILKDVYGKMYSRPGLSLAEREIINITVLTIQGLDRQLFSHIRGAAKVGVSDQSLKKILLLVRGLAGRRFLHAGKIIDAVVSQRKKW